MCYICNPYCGKCRPPKPAPRACDACGALAFEPDECACATCGAALPPVVPPEPRFCHLVREVCANPCGKAAYEVAEAKRCPHHRT